MTELGDCVGTRYVSHVLSANHTHPFLPPFMVHWYSPLIPHMTVDANNGIFATLISLNPFCV